MKKRMMAACLLAMSLTAVFGACGKSEKPKETTTAAAASTAAPETTKAAEETKETATSAAESTAAAAEASVLKPLPGAYTMEDLSNCTVVADFTADDFDWDLNCIYAMIYDIENYDAVEVSKLKVGDTIIAGGAEIEIKTLSDESYGKLINEDQADELTLSPQDGGIYQIVGLDDIRGTILLGQAQLTLSKDVVLHDCTDEPGETVDVAAADLKSYIEGLEDYRKNFTQFATTVLIENDEVTEITRVWRP